MTEVACLTERGRELNSLAASKQMSFRIKINWFRGIEVAPRSSRSHRMSISCMDLTEHVLDVARS